jgi:hypothetical protein
MGDEHQEPGTTEESEIGSVAVRGSASGFAQEVVAASHHMAADEPASVGGNGHRAVSLRLSTCGLGSLHFDHRRDVRSSERMAARGGCGQSVTLEDPWFRLCRLRNQGGHTGSD